MPRQVKQKQFPCIEQPYRCLFTVNFNNTQCGLISNSDGSVSISKEYIDHDFQLVPVPTNSPKTFNDDDSSDHSVEETSNESAVFIKSMKHGRFLVRSPLGNVGLSAPEEKVSKKGQQKEPKVQQEYTKWKMMKCPDGNGMYLTTDDPDQNIMTIDDEEKKIEQELEELEAEEEEEEEEDLLGLGNPNKNKKPFEKIMAAKLMLVVSKKGEIYTTPYKPETIENPNLTVEWCAEFQTGELLFLSSVYSDQRLRCDMTGSLALSSNWKGWEVWRLIETGDSIGSVYICSFCHGKKYLCSEENGRVSTTQRRKTDQNPGTPNDTEGRETDLNNSNRSRGKLSIKDIGKSRFGTEEERMKKCKWIVEKAPIGNDGNPNEANQNGVIIKSVASGKLLRVNGKSICTSMEGNINCALWDLRSGHRQTYYISTIGGVEEQPSQTDADNKSDEKSKKLKGGRRIGTNSRKGLYLSLANNPIKKESEEWHIKMCVMDVPGIVVSFYCSSRKLYLGSTEDGQVFGSASNTMGGTLWKLVENTSTVPGYTFSSYIYNRLLATNEEGNLCTIAPEGEALTSTRVLWNLEPRLPRQVNSSKMKKLAICSTFAIGTTVAAPFVISGAIGILGVAEVGFAAELIAGVGLAAEAMSSVALVASTARTLMNSAEVGVEESEEGKSSQNRPFCEWQNW